MGLLLHCTAHVCRHSLGRLLSFSKKVSERGLSMRISCMANISVKKEGQSDHLIVEGGAELYKKISM